jgi:hypothetical protein
MESFAGVTTDKSDEGIYRRNIILDRNSQVCYLKHETTEDGTSPVLMTGFSVTGEVYL